MSVGDGGHLALLHAMRRHANFAEWLPMTLIVIALLELNGVSKSAIHSLGAALVICRITRAIGLKADTVRSVGRGIGAGGTAIVTLVASVWAIVRYF